MKQQQPMKNQHNTKMKYGKGGYAYTVHFNPGKSAI